MKKKDILVIMPAFNEHQNIGRFLDDITASGILSRCDILVINDGSKDDTSQIVKDRGFNVVTHVYNLGYGCALQTGYKYAVRNDYSYLVQIDSDGQHDVCNIENILAELTREDNPPDIVIGSRFMEGSGEYRMSSVRKLAVRIFRMMIKRSTGQIIKDPTSGLQGLNRKAFLFYSKFNNFVHNYPDANMIIQMLLNEFTMAEIPAVMHQRIAGTSMHSGLKPIIYMMKMFLTTSVVIVREKRRRYREREMRLSEM